MVREGACLRSRVMEDLWVARGSGVGSGRFCREEEEGWWASGCGRSTRRTEAPQEARRRPQKGAV
jgi:hypothetical protein